MGSRSKRRAIFCFLTLLILPGYAFSQTPFYQGKTITMIHNSTPGGSGDLRLRTVTAYLTKHIPGNPTVVIEYMPGGGGRKSANYIYRSARPDGLTIGNMGSGFVPNAILAQAGVQYDLDKFIYLGAPLSGGHHVFLTRKEASLNSIEKLRAASGLRIGAHSVGHNIYNHGRMFAYLIGLKEPKFVTGYSGPEIDLALMRGEVDARANTADSVMSRAAEMLDKSLVDFQAVAKIPGKAIGPVFAHLPNLESFAKSEKERRLVAVFLTFQQTGSPIVVSPGTSKERVQILQEAMRNIWKDPDFHKDFKRATGEDPAPLMPEALEAALKELPGDPEIIDLFKKLTSGDPLPPR